MKTIWKFSLHPDGDSIQVPKGSKVLTVQLQNGSPCVWFLVDRDVYEVGLVRLIIIGTGWDIPAYKDSWNYIGTFQLKSGSLVFHVFAEEQS